MDLSTAVTRYLDVVGEFGRPMPLREFGLPQRELETMLAAWDEDYHVNRHFELNPAPPEASHESDLCWVNGAAYHQIIFKESVRHILGHDLN